MAQKANVTSVDALEAFRSMVVLYINKARPALEEVSAEVMRTRSWLEDEKKSHWINEMKRRSRVLEEAQQALLTARMSNLRDESQVEVMAVHRARRARDEAEDKLRKVKQWDREFDNRVQPLVKQTEKLQTILAHDLVQALAYLSQAMQTLEAYASAGPPSTAAGPGPSADGGAPAATT
jgi:hypothetical protein